MECASRNIFSPHSWIAKHAFARSSRAPIFRMYAPWMRVFRSAALYVPRARIATQRTRNFHASVQARASEAPAPADDNNPDNGSHDDTNNKENSEKENKSPEANGEENIFGEGGLNGNGDGQARGRQKRSNGSLRARTLRSKELPPVHLPEGFRKKHIYRYGEERRHLDRLGLREELKPYEQELLFKLPHKSLNKEAKQTEDPGASKLRKQIDDTVTRNGGRREDDNKETKDSARRLDVAQAYYDIFEAVSWNESFDAIRSFVENECSDQHDLVDRASLQSEILVAAAYGVVGCSVQKLQQLDTDNKLEGAPKFWELAQEYRSPHLARLLLMLTERQPALWPPVKSLAEKLNLRDDLRAVQYVIRTGYPYVPELGLAHNDTLHEAVSSIQSEFAVDCPKGVKMSDLKRPVNILNFPYCEGPSWPKNIVQDIAASVQADVLHLTAHDIALVVGSYVGQEATRAPGNISLLGYKAAENSGRIREEVEDDDGMAKGFPLRLVLGQMNEPRKDSKKRPSLMDQLMGESGREKQDDMWEDMKVNAALDELLHSADVEDSTQRPLIVHIHDYNALGLDKDGGALILSRLRKSIDTMWLDGRKVILVGTCSSQDVLHTYGDGLKQLSSTERLITFQSAPTKLENFDLSKLAETDYLIENEAHLRTVLEALIRPNNEDNVPTLDFDLTLVDEQHRPEHLSDSILPLSEIYRIAKTMIGLRPQRLQSFDQSLLEETVFLIKRIDEAKDSFGKPKRVTDHDKEETSDFSPFGQSRNHENALLSGLVNAKDIRTTFNDVHAPKDTIESIKMLTQLSLLRPEAFSYGVLAAERIPGCLLYGPPGTGKTLLAKAVAKESGANMIEVSGASINNMFVGESEKNVRALFKLAKKKEPLVIFIDEADALLGARGQRHDGAGKRDTINQFLKEWDGMDQMKAFIMVATNRPFDLDEAVLRRLPRKLLIDLPLEGDRAAILKIHLKGEMLDDTVSLEQIAKKTPLYSGSDLKNVAVAAAMAVVKEELDAEAKHSGPEPYVMAPRRILSQRHFDNALSEISASVNEDMQTMNAIKKFDEKYGDGSAKRKKKPGMGFSIAPEKTQEARIRSGK